jgi:hypothetical protein
MEMEQSPALKEILHQIRKATSATAVKFA